VEYGVALIDGLFVQMAGPLRGLFRPSSVCAHARKRGTNGANLHRHPFVAANGTVVHARTPRGYATV
jgi:hypothetical protein